MIKNQEVADQLTRARTGLIIDMPFFGELALRLKVIEDYSVPTLVTNGKFIKYNPDFTKTLSPSLTKSAFGHEVGHCIYEHMSRRGDRNPKKWNMAGDYVINAMLKDSGFEIGEGWLFNPAFAGMGTDEIYALLPDMPEDEGGSGEPGGPLDNCEDSDSDSSETDAIEWKIAVIQAANSAKMHGKLPASMERFIEEITTAKVDWREQLRRFVTEISKNDYTWSRPNRRFVAHNLFLPSAYSESMGLLVDAIDTSGSITQDVLNAFGSEISAAWNLARPEQLVNIYCDAAINHVDTFNSGDELHFKMHGGGGTDFNPPFEYIEQQGIKPACFIYLTDGYGPFPKEPPDYPVLWCMTTDVVAPWGETIRVEI